jgi:hypothetical protein
MLEVMNETANKAINGNFVAEISKVGEEFLVSVKHYNIDEDPCAGQSQVVSELYKVLGACNLDKVGSVSHSGGCASVRAKKEKQLSCQIANYSVEMTKSQMIRWNSGSITPSDENEILVNIPTSGNNYKVVKLCDLDEATKDFMNDFGAEFGPFDKSSTVQMILDVMNDGSRIDRFLHRSTHGTFYLSDISEDGVKLPVCHDSEPTEEDAEHFMSQLN